MEKLIREKIEKSKDSYDGVYYTIMEVFDILIRIKELKDYPISVDRNTLGEIIFRVGDTIMLSIDEKDI